MPWSASQHVTFKPGSDTGECLQTLEGHTDEIFSCAFNYEGDTIITGAEQRSDKHTATGLP